MIPTIIEQINSLFKESFNKLNLKDFPVMLTQATKVQFGDYQVNGIMSIAKDLKKNPRELAAMVIDNLPNNIIISKLEIAGPGFINITLNDQFLIDFITKLNLSQDLTNNVNKYKNIVIDYSSPNLAKEMHVGHLRSTVIGDMLARVLEYVGYNVIRQNHVGDWGTQFGMLITYILENKKDDLDDFSHDLSDLEIFYRKAKLRFDEDTEFAEKSRNHVVILQNWQEYGETGELIYKYWQYFTNESFKHCQNIYELLNINLSSKDVFGESKYNKFLPEIVKKLEEKDLITISNGAKCVFLDKDDDCPPFIIQKNDGGYLYATTDLAAIDYRVNTLKAFRILYVVDARQSLHFEQLFNVAKLANIVNDDILLEHISFGTMMGEDGRPFKTRNGDVIKLVDLINEAQKRAEKILQEKNPDWNDDLIKNIANKMAISALKYADLSKNRNSDYIFSFDKMLAFDGNTAPYLLYALARINSLIKKTHFQNFDELDQIKLVVSNLYERNLILHLAKFSTVLNDVINESLPHLFCQYLYNLAVYFMQFYENCNILKEEDNNLKNSKIKLLIKVSELLNLGLNLLGITTIEQM
jgi:arginyl-tRNA synthetase